MSDQITQTPPPIQTEENPIQSRQTPITEKKPHSLVKKIVMGIGIIFTIILITGAIGVYTLAKQLIPSTSNATTDNSAQILNNPLVQKLAQKLPIPRITMIPITLSPTQTINQPANGSPAKTTPAVLTNLKTYTNTNDNFSISYPGSETVLENPHGMGVTDVTFFNTANGSSKESPDFQFLIFPKTIGNLIGQDFDQLYNLPSPSAQIMKSNTASQQFTKTQNRNIKELRAFDYISTSYPSVPNEEPEVGTYIETRNNILSISTGQSNKSILDTMVNTFKSPL